MVRMTRVAVLDWPKVTRQFGRNRDLGCDQPSRVGHFQTSADPTAMSAFLPIVLQKSQKALRPILRQRTKQARIVDQCSLKAVPGIAGEFAAWRRSPPHYYSIVAPTARSI
jgi:hypothetical protein